MFSFVFLTPSPVKYTETFNFGCAEDYTAHADGTLNILGYDAARYKDDEAVKRELDLKMNGVLEQGIPEATKDVSLFCTPADARCSLSGVIVGLLRDMGIDAEAFVSKFRIDNGYMKEAMDLYKALYVPNPDMTDSPAPQIPPTLMNMNMMNSKPSGDKYCRDCGTKREGTAAFCTNCGKKFE